MPKPANAGGNDLAEVMKQALTEEQKNREQLQVELAKAREDARQQQNQIATETIEPRTAVRRGPSQHPGAQPEIAKQCHRNFDDPGTLAAKEAEIQKQNDLAAALQKQLAQLNSQLRSADVEKRIATGQVALMQQQVQAERAQNARLAEGVKALATNSGALTAGNPRKPGPGPQYHF